MFLFAIILFTVLGHLTEIAVALITLSLAWGLWLVLERRTADAPATPMASGAATTEPQPVDVPQPAQAPGAATPTLPRQSVQSSGAAVGDEDRTEQLVH